MRDRLRAVECPSEAIDQIGGWARKGTGECYGEGYRVHHLKTFLVKFFSLVSLIQVQKYLPLTKPQLSQALL
jgi:hypothetical protein